MKKEGQDGVYSIRISERKKKDEIKVVSEEIMAGSFPRYLKDTIQV